MAFIIKFVYSFPLSFTGKLIITEERKSFHLVALFFHVLEPRTLLELFYSIMWDFFFQKIFWETSDFRKKKKFFFVLFELAQYSFQHLYLDGSL